MQLLLCENKFDRADFCFQFPYDKSRYIHMYVHISTISMHNYEYLSK